MIGPHEVEIRCEWKPVGKQMQESHECQRIKQLTNSYLLKLASDASGWGKLYQDPNDKRYWELIYPQSEMQGGGPPLLRVFTREAALSKYKL